MNKQDYEKIVNKYGKKIFNYLLKILRNQEDAEDIYQEVFLAFYQKIDNVDPEFYNSYLFKTAYHKALNLIKKRKKKKKFNYHFEDLENIQAYNNSESDETIKERSERIKNALSQLSVKEATLIELQFYQNKSYKEIADFFSTTVSAIDSRLVRAKKKLRKIILQDFKKNDVYINKEVKNEKM